MIGNDPRDVPCGPSNRPYEPDVCAIGLSSFYHAGAGACGMGSDLTTADCLLVLRSG